MELVVTGWGWTAQLGNLVWLSAWLLLRGDYSCQHTKEGMRNPSEVLVSLVVVSPTTYFCSAFLSLFLHGAEIHESIIIITWAKVCTRIVQSVCC